VEPEGLQVREPELVLQRVVQELVQVPELERVAQELPLVVPEVLAEWLLLERAPEPEQVAVPVVLPVGQEVQVVLPPEQALLPEPQELALQGLELPEVQDALLVLAQASLLVLG